MKNTKTTYESIRVRGLIYIKFKCVIEDVQNIYYFNF